MATDAISSRSVDDSERVERPRTDWISLVSAALGAGSVCGAIERPRVSGFFGGGASARTISSSVTFLLLPSSPANASGIVSDSAAPTVMMDRIAVSPLCSQSHSKSLLSSQLARFQNPCNKPPEGGLRHPSD
ncbi:hypothetical protein ACVWW7_003425 [Bradyrhizobium sp. LM6.9]